MNTICNLAVANNWNPDSQSITGRLEVFTTPTAKFGAAITLNHIWQTAPNNGWSDWETLGGHVAEVLGDKYAGAIAVAANCDGRLEAFAIDSHGTLNHIWQTTPGGGWSDWVTLDSGRQIATIAAAQYFRLPYRGSCAGAGQNQDGRLEIFGIDVDGTPLHIWQTSPGGAWTDWSNLSNGYGGIPMAVGQNIDGRLEVFGVDGYGTVFHSWQTTPNGDWSDWATLCGGYTIVPLALGQNADGRLELFGIDIHGTLFHIWQITPGGDWSDSWVSLGGGYQIGWIAVAQNEDGRLEAFGVDARGTLLHIWQVTPGGGWSDGWTPLGNGHQTTKIVVGNNTDGRLEIFDINCSGTSFHIWQTEPNGDWSNWAALTGIFVL